MGLGVQPPKPKQHVYNYNLSVKMKLQQLNLVVVHIQVLSKVFQLIFTMKGFMLKSSGKNCPRQSATQWQIFGM